MITRNPLFATLRSICVFIEFSGNIGMFQSLIRELRALPLCCIHCLTTKMNVHRVKTPVGDCSGSERLHALQKLTMD